MADVTEYETHYPHRIHVVCPYDALDIDVSHDVPANHVFAEGTCKRSGASLDDARTRLVMNDPSVGAFTQGYRIDLRIETDRNGNETPYYVTFAQCPYDECDGETSLSWIEGTTGSALTGHDDHGHCKTCGGAIAGVDWRVGTDRIDRLQANSPRQAWRSVETSTRTSSARRRAPLRSIVVLLPAFR